MPEAFITDDGEVHFSRHSDGKEVAWVGPLDTDHPSCYQATPIEPAPNIVESVQRIVVAGAEYIVEGGQVVIDGVTYAVNAGQIVVDTYENLSGALKAALVAEIRNALEELDESVVAAICTNMLVGTAVDLAATAILTKVLSTAVAAVGISLAVSPAVIATAAVIALFIAGCTLAQPWYTPDAPTPPTGLSLVTGNESLQVSWDASPSRDTFQFGYSLRWKLASQSWADATAETLDDSATSYRITGLLNNTAYDVQIEAHNLGGTSSEVTARATPRVPTTTSTTTTTTIPL